MFHFQDEVYDRRLGRHLVSLYYRSADQAADELLDMTILRDYLVSKYSNHLNTERLNTRFI